MTTYKQGDVVTVPFPFTEIDSTSNTLQTKGRPALVLSANWYNNDHRRQECILAAISTSVPEILDRDEIKIAASEISMTGLHKESVIKVGTLFTIKQECIRRTIGHIPSAIHKKTIEKLQSLFSNE